MEREEQTDTEAEHDLSEYFEASRHTFLVFAEDFDVVVNEADEAQPQGGDEHGYDVDVVEFGKEEGWNHNGGEDKQAAHSGGAFLFFLSLEAEVADGLAY